MANNPSKPCLSCFLGVDMDWIKVPNNPGKLSYLILGDDSLAGFCVNECPDHYNNILMATEQDLENTIARFAQNFQEDGFAIFDSGSSINFMGNLLLNYKGMRIVRFKKSQLMPEQFCEPDFRELCTQVLSGPNKRQQLFGVLKEQYPHCSVCVLEGGLHRISGELAAFKKDNVLVLLF